MLSRNTFLIDLGSGERPAVRVLSDDDVAMFYDALNMAEAVRGPASFPVVFGRYLAEGAVRFWHLYSAERCAAIAEDSALPVNIRQFAAAIALGKVLPGSFGSAPTGKGPSGGQRAKLDPPKPVRPSGGNAAPTPVSAVFGA